MDIRTESSHFKTFSAVFSINAEFTLSAADGFRDVTLTFLVNGDPLGRMCKLDWDDWLVPCGSIVSTDRN